MYHLNPALQSLFGGDGQTSCLRDRDKIAKVAKLHSDLPYLRGMPLSLQSLFRGRWSAYLSFNAAARMRQAKVS